MEDGGWNCEWENGSVRSSFHSTLNVLKGLLSYELTTGGSDASQDLRRTGEEYLLERRLRLRLSTGELVGAWVHDFAYPYRWAYSALNAADHFRAAGLADGRPPDPRLGDAIEIIRGAQQPDGRWVQQDPMEGREWFPIDVPSGQPSKWLTFHATRTLDWWTTCGDGATQPRRADLQRSGEGAGWDYLTRRSVRVYGSGTPRRFLMARFGDSAEHRAAPLAMVPLPCGPDWKARPTGRLSQQGRTKALIVGCSGKVVGRPNDRRGALDVPAPIPVVGRPSDEAVHDRKGRRGRSERCRSLGHLLRPVDATACHRQCGHCSTRPHVIVELLNFGEPPEPGE